MSELDAGFGEFGDDVAGVGLRPGQAVELGHDRVSPARPPELRVGRVDRVRAVRP
jgi:hypothetical protein